MFDYHMIKETIKEKVKAKPKFYGILAIGAVLVVYSMIFGM